MKRALPPSGGRTSRELDRRASPAHELWALWGPARGGLVIALALVLLAASGCHWLLPFTSERREAGLSEAGAGDGRPYLDGGSDQRRDRVGDAGLTGDARLCAKLLKGECWDLVFVDEFSGAGIDPFNWVEVGDAGNARVSGGSLLLSATGTSGNGYTSGAIQSRGRFWTVGDRFEVRAKLPAGSAQATLKLNSTEDLWPPSFHVFEYDPSSPTKVSAGYEGEVKGYYGPFTAPVDLTQGYHTYVLSWQPGSKTQAATAEWYFDDTLYFDSVPVGLADTHPMFLYFKIEPDSSPPTLAATLAVEWIKVYRKQTWGPYDDNHVQNGSFNFEKPTVDTNAGSNLSSPDAWRKPWSLWAADMDLSAIVSSQSQPAGWSSKAFTLAIQRALTEDVILSQGHLALHAGKTYKLGFTGGATSATTSPTVSIELIRDADSGKVCPTTVSLTATPTLREITCTIPSSPVPIEEYHLRLELAGPPSTLWVDDVHVRPVP
jgi:beta-glucanase (GH16 family)